MVVKAAPAWLYDEQNDPTGLMARARKLIGKTALKAPFNGTVLWSGLSNAERAERLVASHPTRFRNIQSLLREQDNKILADLEAASWQRQEPIWWLLSAELARNAEGEVWVFGSGRVLLGSDKPTRTDANARQNWYSDTVFEKVELPELENNSRVTKIFLMGKNIGDKPRQLESGDKAVRLVR